MLKVTCGLLVSSVLLLSCGKAIKDADGPSGGSGGMGAGGDAGASGNTSGDSGAAGSPTCPLGLASAEEIAATPRADINLELLALQLSPGHFIADPSIYDRVVRDVTAIRVADPAIADIGFFASTDGRGIYLDIDDDTFAEMQQGTYHAWDCLNETYGKTGLNLGTPNPQFPNSGTITLKGIYDIPQLVPLYAELKGIKSAGQNYDGIGDGPTICVTPSPTVWHYVFDRAGGDCPAGCTTHEYHHFSTSLAGDIESLGDLQPSEVDTYASLKACRGR